MLLTAVGSGSSHHHTLLARGEAMVIIIHLSGRECSAISICGIVIQTKKQSSSIKQRQTLLVPFPIAATTAHQLHLHNPDSINCTFTIRTAKRRRRGECYIIVANGTVPNVTEVSQSQIAQRLLI